MFKATILIISILFLSFNTFSQFSTISHSTTNSFEFAEISEPDGVALVGGIKAMKSLDDGLTWTEMSLGGFGLPYALYNYKKAAIISPQTYCLVGKDDNNYKGIIIRTTDGGLTWTNVLESANSSFSFYEDIAQNGNTVIATSKGGINRSTDGGATWSYISIPQINYSTTPNIITYNELTGAWTVSYNGNLTLKSLDGGLTWNSIASSNYISGLRHFSNINNDFLITASQAQTSTLMHFDQNLQLTNSIYINAIKTFNSRIDRSHFLPSNDILSASSTVFMKIDTATSNVYYYNHNLVDPTTGDLVQTTDFDLGQTYGIAVGQYGGLSRFDMSQPEDLYIPADFDLVGSVCPGDTIYATPAFNYADSVKWFFDGNLVSTDTNLIYETPNLFGTFDIVHETWYKGTVRTDSQEVYFQPLNPAPTYSFGNIDTMPCFQSHTAISITPTGNYIYNSALEIWLDDQMLDSLSPPPSSTYGIYSPIIDSQDTVYLVSKRPQQCGTTIDSTQLILYPGDDLNDDYQLLPLPDSLCSGTPLNLQLTGTNLNYSYQFLFTGSASYTSGSGATFQGTGIDTMNLLSPYVSYYDDAKYYIQLLIKDNQENCQSSVIYFDTVTVIDPKSLFQTDSYGYYRSDTVGILNSSIKPNRTWSANPSGLTIQNISDTVPIIFGDTTGVFAIELINTPLLGCSDTSKIQVTFADTMQILGDSLCAEESGDSRYTIMKLQLDNQGNIFELGVYHMNNGYSGGTPAFHLTKKDENGVFLWEQKATPYISDDIKGVVIEDIDFDENGDVYAVLWLQCTMAGYTHDAINFQSHSGQNTGTGYIVKFDGQTGTMLWAKDLADYPIYTSYSILRVISIVVTGTEIHISAGTNHTILIISADLNGNYISRYAFSQVSIPEHSLIHNVYGYAQKESIHSPQLIEMSNGEILGVGYYSNKVMHGNTWLTHMETNYTSVMMFKYNSQIGLYDFKKIITPGSSQILNNHLDGIPMFGLDKNDNITMLLASKGFGETISIADSLQIGSNSTIVFQIDKNFQFNWVTTGTFSIANSLNVASETGEIFISGTTGKNIAFTDAVGNKIMGEDGNYTPNSTSNMVSPFIIRMDSSGIINGGYLFHPQNSTPFCQSKIKNEIDVTPCGDIAAVLISPCTTNTPQTFTEYKTGMTLNVDQSKTYVLRSDCIGAVCNILNLGYDTLQYCSLNDSLFVPVGSNSFNVDSASYELIENGIVINTETVPVSYAGFKVHIPNTTSDFSLKILSPGPVYDSITIEISNQVQATYNFNASMCWGENQLISGLPSSNDFLWQNDLTIGQSQLLDSSSYSLGVNYIDVISTDANGCKQYDTLQIDIHENTSNYLFDSTICWGDSLTLSGTPAINNYVWNSNTSLGQDILFDENNYSSGLNYFDVVSTDTNGCLAFDTLAITVHESMSNFSYNPTMCWGENQTLSGLTSNTDYLWLDSISLGQSLLLDTSLYSNGENYFNVLSTNSFGCIAHDTLNVTVFEEINPNLDTLYNIPCYYDLSIPIQSSNYISEDWIANGNVTSNYFSSNNLNMGINYITVNLVDTNFCAKSYNTIIHLCYNLGTEDYEKNNIQIVPNPNKGNFEVRFNGLNGKGKISLYSSDGRLIHENNTILKDSFKLQIDTAPGVYWLWIETKNDLIQRKVVIR
ncbi:T9SS type A sorting domain-containing protein [Brumimicrobium mesophilum]|uniref:T9SS type A sorting domain-containing protein n=1 Tax=Brumimicrobium mesophilum TaxID=392717 RepID=UPI000D144D67|nr:T9SS type A sorting domain-containing protein [Brumimicrobium mesophilum]